MVTFEIQRRTRIFVLGRLLKQKWGKERGKTVLVSKENYLRPTNVVRKVKKLQHVFAVLQVWHKTEEFKDTCFSYKARIREFLKNIVGTWKAERMLLRTKDCQATTSNGKEKDNSFREHRGWEVIMCH